MANVSDIRRLHVDDELAFVRATGLWDYSSGFNWSRPSPNQSFSEFVQRQRDHERGIDLPPQFVPDTALYAFSDGEIVGRVSIRHILNDFLLKIGGHIGYGVIPKYRRQGVASALLVAGLNECRNLKISRALLTCDDDNIGSIKTIEKNGGVLENVVDQGPGKVKKRRYWIAL